MAKFHVNPKTGRTSACGAATRCPFGGAEEHFPSREEAQAAYEKTQRAQEVPPARKKASPQNEGIRQRDLREAVKTTTDAKTLSHAAETGDEGVMRELASNPAASHTDVQKAYGKTNNAKTKALLEAHPNFDKKSFTMKEVEAITADPSRHRELVAFINGHATDRLVARVSTAVGPDSPLQKTILTSGNRQISRNTRLQALKAVEAQHPSSLPADVVTSPHFAVKDYVADMDDSHREWVARSARQPETMEALEHVVLQDLRKPRYPETTNDLAVEVYKNEATPDRVKAELVEASPDAASYHKLTEARATRFPEFSEISYERPASTRALAAGDEETFVFDADKMKMMGFGSNEVKVFMRHMGGHDLYEESYDERSGVFRGKRLWGDPDAP